MFFIVFCCTFGPLFIGIGLGGVIFSNLPDWRCYASFAFGTIITITGCILNRRVYRAYLTKADKQFAAIRDAFGGKKL